MHEFSLVRSLLAQVRAIADQQAAESVSKVTVTIGPLSGVEPVLVIQAFDQLASRYDLDGAVLSIIDAPLRACCCDCGKEFEVQQFEFRCPSCTSHKIRVVSGDEIRLLELTVIDQETSTVPEVEKQ